MLGHELFQSHNVFGDADRENLYKRVGLLQLLNPFQADGCGYTCNLCVYEERMIVEFLMQLTSGEPGAKVVGPLVSASWVQKGVPDDDVVIKCTYETTAMSISPQFRQQLAVKYCGAHFAALSIEMCTTLCDRTTMPRHSVMAGVGTRSSHFGHDRVTLKHSTKPDTTSAVDSTFGSESSLTR
jgi:hypothetical protein